MGLILRLLLNALAVFAASYFVPGIILSDFWTAVVVALVLGLINVLVKPILTIITFPITVLTLGLFSIVLNALLFWLAAYFVPGFDITGFVPALIGSLIVSIVVWIGEEVLGID